MINDQWSPKYLNIFIACINPCPLVGGEMERRMELHLFTLSIHLTYTLIKFMIKFY